jgi:isoquinoline 1-oxidoreductase beta subunit
MTTEQQHLAELDRRAFLIGSAGAAGGFLFGIPNVASHAIEGPWEITCWVTIAPDNTVMVRTARSEMGQGVLTALAMLVAEELECDWNSVRTEFVSPQENLRRNGAWGDLSTSASRSIAFSQQYLRQAGAAAREMLLAAAAARWGVAPSECHAQTSTITHRGSARSVTFGEVAQDAAKMPIPDKVTLKNPSEWKLVGTPRRRLDVPDKVTGRTVYGIDVALPHMLYAAIVQCPTFHGSLQDVDESSVAGMRGVRRVVRMADAVAVVAESWWQAKRAAEVLKVTWDARGNAEVSTETITTLVRGGLGAAHAQIGRARGDVTAALATAARRIEADYSVPFLAHATMEPQTCTAHVKADGVEIWVPTQDAATALANAAAAAGVPREKVVVHRTALGGGFGRRAPLQEYVRQAVLIAKEVKQPVKLIWTREEDIQHDWYRPCGMARLVAGLAPDGMPLAWSIRLSGPSLMGFLGAPLGKRLVDRSFVSGLADEMPYDVANYLVDCAICKTTVPVGPWRAINFTQNAFYRESFVDEMAHAAGIDPYVYRRRLLHNQPTSLAVLDAAAQKAGWDLPAPAGVSRGIAFDNACGSICAEVVELSVEGGRVRVHRVVSALDCGHVVNPMSIEMQVQGGIVYALTAALYGEITIKDGAAEQSNFHDYQMIRMAEAPMVETVIVPSGGFWGGVGEPPVPPLAPALCNAIFAATGNRIRALPVYDGSGVRLQESRIKNTESAIR